MTIQFMCPNGHTLSAPDHHAGKEGKCPKSDSEFLVPELEEFAAAVEEEDESAEIPTEVTSETPAKEDQIVFLCPNGHKLSGPSSLKGKPGQCPHCDSKFVIPSDDDEEEDEEEEVAEEPVEAEEVPLGTPVDESEIVSDDLVEEISEADIVEDPIAPPIDGAHQMGAIFYQLNSVLDEDRVIELLLEDGEKIIAHKISLTLSQSDYAVLAHIDEDEATSIVTVPWSDVKRATIRKVTELPEGWFR